jgi:hypothetical protein
MCGIPVAIGRKVLALPSERPSPLAHAGTLPGPGVPPQGKSLQQYLAGELARLAARPTTEELFARIERRKGGRVGLKQAAEDIADERSRR